MIQRILMIDDTKSVHAFVKSLLSNVPNLEIKSVFDGKQALELLQADSNFDVILLDWEMPNMDGPTTFQNLKAGHISIPTIMMTTKNLPQNIEYMLSQGVAEYLMKPFTVDIIAEKIEYATGKRLSYAA